MAAKYTYFLDFGSGEVEIIPDKDVVYEWKKESSDIAIMRKNIKSLTFTKDFDNQGTFTNVTPFNTLWEWYFDITKHTIEISVLIYKDSVLDYQGLFYVVDGSINVNTGVFIIKPVPDDAYRLILNGWEEKIDIIDPSLTPHIARWSYSTVEQQEPGTAGGDPPDIPPFGVWEEIPPHTNVWVRQKSYVDLGLGWTEYNGFWYQGWIGVITTDFDFPNCYYLTDVIQFLVTTVLNGTSLSAMTVTSNFFNDPTNYVTGDVNKLMNTLIEQKSDTKDPDASNEALVGLISLKEMMEELKKIFNVSWYVDSNGDFRVEHEKYFYNGLSIGTSKTVGIDLTNSSKYVGEESGKFYIEDSQNYEGLSIDKIKSETIIFPEGITLEFRSDKNYITYDVLAEVITKKEHNVILISTDLGAAVSYPDDLSDDGFFLFNCEAESGGYCPVISIPYNYSLVDTVQTGNAGFSGKWLLYNYYTYGRINKSGVLTFAGTMAGSFSVEGTISVFMQKDIVFLLNNSDTIDINKYIRTYLIKSDGGRYNNDGNIEKIEHDLETDFVKVTLGYEL